MAKKNIIHTKKITEEDILSLYEGVLPLLYLNPEKLDPPYQLNKQLLRFIHYDLFHYVMDDSKLSPSYLQRHVNFQKWIEPENTQGISSLTVLPLNDSNLDQRFDQAVDHSYQTMTKHICERYNKDQKYYYHRIQSDDEPKVVVGFFRIKKTSNENPFTKKEILLLEKCSPHIFIILRTVLSPLVHTQQFQSFDMNMSICSKISYDCSLSDTESKFLPEILFGYSNQEIATRLFVSLATVKKHIQHIFKKTETKNRVDFISKFFTSPNQLDL